MPTIPKTASPAATILIIGEEALELVAYLDSTDIVTIGVGHVILPKFDAALFNLTPQRLQELITDAQKRRVMPAATKNLLRITRDQALALLAKDIAQVVLFINSVTRVDLNQNQLDALTSFIFNIGQGHYATSSTRKALDKGNYAGAAAAMELWNEITDRHGNKQVSTDLVKRRAHERALFEAPVQ